MGHSINSKQIPHSPSASSRRQARVGERAGSPGSASEGAPAVLPLTSSLLILSSTCDINPPLQSLVQIKALTTLGLAICMKDSNFVEHLGMNVQEHADRLIH